MRLIKSKLKNGVWYDDVLWKVRDIISPNEFQDFIIIERVGETVEEDGTDTVEMSMLDANNDNFYPNVPDIAKIMKRRELEDERRHSEEYGGALDPHSITKHYLSIFKE